MARSFWARGGCLATAVAAVAAVSLVPFQGYLWDGGFASAEYRLLFADAGGRPVPGVLLRVYTAAGGVSYAYPIDEFVPDDTPASDADGRLTVHHDSGGLEFGGMEYRNIVGMRFGESDAPQYVCVFSLGGREVGRLRYDDLRPRDGWAGHSRVTRDRTPSAWPPREAGIESAARLRLFDGNGDGRLDREEATAAFHAFRAAEREGKSEFLIVERTITVDALGR